MEADFCQMAVLSFGFLPLQLQFYLKRAAGGSENRVIIPLGSSYIFILSLTSFRLLTVVFFDTLTEGVVVGLNS